MNPESMPEQNNEGAEEPKISEKLEDLKGELERIEANQRMSSAQNIESDASVEAVEQRKREILEEIDSRNS